MVFSRSSVPALTDHSVWSSTVHAGPFPSSSRLRAHQNINHPVEIVEEREEVESQFAPAFFLTERQDVGVHDGCGVVESWTAHHRSAHISPDVISQQRQVETESEPLSRTEEHHTEEEVDEILWKHQRI